MSKPSVRTVSRMLDEFTQNSVAPKILYLEATRVLMFQSLTTDERRIQGSIPTSTQCATWQTRTVTGLNIQITIYTDKTIQKDMAT